MTKNTVELRNGLKAVQSAQRVAIGQRCAEMQCVAPGREVARQRQVGRKRIVEITMSVRWKRNRSEKALEFAHFVGREQRCGEQIRERLIEVLNAQPIAPPMKWFMADDVLQGERDHRPFHRMEDERRIDLWPRRIAQVPRQSVHAPVDRKSVAEGKG